MQSRRGELRWEGCRWVTPQSNGSASQTHRDTCWSNSFRCSSPSCAFMQIEVLRSAAHAIHNFQIESWASSPVCSSTSTLRMPSWRCIDHHAIASVQPRGSLVFLTGTIVVKRTPWTEERSSFRKRLRLRLAWLVDSDPPWFLQLDVPY